MAVSWLPVEQARTQGRAITTAVRSASGGDRRVYELAVAAMAALPTASTGTVLAAVVRLLVEDAHPSGVDGDDIREMLERCQADAGTWLAGAVVSPRILVAVLSSALGIHEPGVTYVELRPADRQLPDGEWTHPESARTTGATAAALGQPSPPTAAEYAWHAPVLIASLLAVAGHPVSKYLDTAFADIARAELMEMP